MASKFYDFSGKCKWAKLYPGMEDQKYGHFGINFYPDNLEAFKATEVQLKERTDDDGTFFQLRRSPTKLIKGDVVQFGPPKVLDKENAPFEGLIGNGSKITVKIVVYDTIKGKGHRLEAVRVDELVEYHRPEDPGVGANGNIPKLPF